jgi:hypothetical protein
MSGFFHYFLSALDPMRTRAFRAFVALMFSELPYLLFALVCPDGTPRHHCLAVHL